MPKSTIVKIKTMPSTSRVFLTTFGNVGQVTFLSSATLSLTLLGFGSFLACFLAFLLFLSFLSAFCSFAFSALTS